MKIKTLLLGISLLTLNAVANETSLTGSYKGILNCPGEGKVGKLYAILEQNGTEITGQFLVNDTFHNIEIGYADDEGVFSMTSDSLDFNGEYGTNFKKISGTSCKKNDGIFKLFKTKNIASIEDKITQAKQFRQQKEDKKLAKSLTGVAKQEYQQCQKGVTAKCTSLGYSYKHGADGAKQSDTQAVKYLQKGCDGGYAVGCNSLGSMYKKGRGVEQSDTQAVKYYQKGCDGGDVYGCNNLGVMYEKGRGVEQSHTQAVKYYQKACDEGNVSIDNALVCSKLGFMYEVGRGVEQSDTQAVKYYQKGCDGLSAHGCGNLGNMYYHGRGVSKNETKALKYLKRGCNRGNEWGCNKIKEYNLE